MLCPVPVVHVPVEDQHLLKTVLFLQVPRQDGDVVEQTKSHRLLLLGVMTGRADEAKGVVHGTVQHTVGKLDRRAHRKQRDIEGLPGDAYVHRVQKRITRRAGRLSAVDVLGGVHLRHPVPVRGSRADPHERVEPRLFAEMTVGGPQPVTSFRMPGAGVMLQKGGVVKKSRCHNGLFIAWRVGNANTKPDERGSLGCLGGPDIDL